MQEVVIKNKQKYLDDNYPFEDAPKLTDKKPCIHFRICWCSVYWFCADAHQQLYYKTKVL